MDPYCDGKSKKSPAMGRRRRYCRCGTTMLTMLLFVVTNSASVLLSSGAGAFLLRRYKPATARLWAWDDSAALLDDLNATQSALADTHAQLADLHARLGTANSLLETLLAAMAAERQDGGTPWARELSGELELAVAPHRNVTGKATVFPALGHACARFQDDLEAYMRYTPGGECPPTSSWRAGS